MTEIDKLASFTNGRETEETDVAAVVGVRRGETMADFLDCVAERNLTLALELLPHILSQPKTSAVQLVMGLTAQTLALAMGESAASRGFVARQTSGRILQSAEAVGFGFYGSAMGICRVDVGGFR